MLLRLGLVWFCLCLSLPLSAAEDRGAVTAQPNLSTSGPVAIAATRPRARSEALPRMAWGRQGDTAIWTRAALSALQGHASALTETVPRDIDAWCPAYRGADAAQRRAFWAGFASALARHESGQRAGAVGGGGLYHGLLQILPATAQGYGCAARSGAALQNGAANLSCGLRIMARTVPRDGVIAQQTDRWRGVAADWGPMRSAAKRDQMQGWLRRQSYCTPLSAVRPKARPAGLVADQSSEKG
ncbi:transglycosylase SLT domain-containing protein [Seohaeicola saemankumensis]|uniref:transglycosylase SLT domain-containing protein n=1 Tax=Seohaeicola TaxID=481178 RepID=UPI0035CECF58